MATQNTTYQPELKAVPSLRLALARYVEESGFMLEKGASAQEDLHNMVSVVHLDALDHLSRHLPAGTSGRNLLLKLNQVLRRATEVINDTTERIKQSRLEDRVVTVSAEDFQYLVTECVSLGLCEGAGIR